MATTDAPVRPRSAASPIVCPATALDGSTSSQTISMLLVAPSS
jgi:hypothetical protein